ncbi:mitochondrial ATP synthase epsilon chain-domain-containing protein [Globomyces pollinis-pini]|nr:mitochondrial ATP synthase epsilon chain-domain-containing protein [Globomyces pollinis-pini]
MSFWRAAGFSYLQYTNIGARTLRSILVPEAKAIAIKREEIALKRAIWSDGKMGDSVC